MSHQRFSLNVMKVGDVQSRTLDISAASAEAATRAAEEMGWTVLGVSGPKVAEAGGPATMDDLQRQLRDVTASLEAIRKSSMISSPVLTIAAGIIIATLIVSIAACVLGRL